MKTTLEFESDERMEAKLAFHAYKLWDALCEVDQECRNRLKHADDVSDAEHEFLEHIREVCYIARLLEEEI